MFCSFNCCLKSPNRNKKKNLVRIFLFNKIFSCKKLVFFWKLVRFELPFWLICSSCKELRIRQQSHQLFSFHVGHCHEYERKLICCLLQLYQPQGCSCIGQVPLHELSLQHCDLNHLHPHNIRRREGFDGLCGLFARKKKKLLRI